MAAMQPVPAAVDRLPVDMVGHIAAGKNAGARW